MYETKAQRRLLKQSLLRGYYAAPIPPEQHWKIWRAAAVKASADATRARRALAGLHPDDGLQLFHHYGALHYNAMCLCHTARTHSGVNYIPPALRA